MLRLARASLFFWLATAGAMTVLPGAAWAQRPASTFAELDLWQKARTSNDLAVVRSYIEKYPDGEFIAEARERLRQLGGTVPAAQPSAPPAPPRPATASPSSPVVPAAPPAPVAPRPATAAPAAPPPPSGPVAAPTALVEMTPVIIREVRQLLYDRGYAIRKVDGSMGDDLKLAITRVQSQMNQQQTGVLTNGQLAAVRRVTPSPNWGAIAYIGEGVNSGALNRPSRGIAEEEAKLACKKRSGRECNVLAVAGKSCLAFSHSVGVINRVRSHTTTAGYGDSIETAKEKSQFECRGLSKTPNGCSVKRVVCADGRAEEPPAGKGKRRG